MYVFNNTHIHMYNYTLYVGTLPQLKVIQEEHESQSEGKCVEENVKDGGSENIAAKMGKRKCSQSRSQPNLKVSMAYEDLLKQVVYYTLKPLGLYITFKVSKCTHKYAYQHANKLLV